MGRIFRTALATLSALALSACRLGDPSTMLVAMSAHTDHPVVVTAMVVNGQAVEMIPAVVRGVAENGPESRNEGGWLLGYPSGKPGLMQLDLTWVELPAGAAYRASIEVPLKALSKSGSGARSLRPVFAPGGLLLMGSDSATADIVRLCATRTPAADVDYAATPRQLPGLFEALETARLASAATDCSD